MLHGHEAEKRKHRLTKKQCRAINCKAICFSCGKCWKDQVFCVFSSIFF